jgi:DNA-binding NarL/FixJ family response regulator
MKDLWDADDAAVITVAPSEIDRHRIRDILGAKGIAVRGTTCLEEAFEAVSVPAPVVLYDTEGDEPWSEALIHLVQRWPNTRFVLVSRLADEQMWIDALEAGAYDLLPKPFEPVELQCVVRSALVGLWHAPVQAA